ncbi:MAG: hypothetical protein U0821_09485 [Chloroflexota bacterium]
MTSRLRRVSRATVGLGVTGGDQAGLLPMNDRALAEWPEGLGNPLLANAALDRLIVIARRS